jgi:hypothetical protein
VVYKSRTSPSAKTTRYGGEALDDRCSARRISPIKGRVRVGWGGRGHTSPGRKALSFFLRSIIGGIGKMEDAPGIETVEERGTKTNVCEKSR